MTARSVLSGCALYALCATAGSVFANGEPDMATMLMAAQASEETDLPPELVEAINGTPFPRTSGDSTGEVIQDVYPKTKKLLETKDNWKERKPKRIFIWSVGEIVKIMDDKTLLNLLKSCGYTIYNDYILPEGREFEIRGFLNKDGVPGCGTLADNLVQIVCPRIENVCTALGDIPSDWTDSFELSIEILGIELVDLDDTYVDWGDIYAVEGALKTLEAALYLLQGTEMSTDDVFELMEKFGEFHGNAGDSLILVPQLFKGVRNQEALNKAKASLQSAIGFLKKARTKVENRTDGRKHLISFKEDGSLLEIAGSAASYVNAALDNLDLLNAALTGTVTLDLKTLLVDGFGVTLPDWMKDSYEISLAPIFEGKLNASLVEGLIADGFVWPAQMKDPTMGGLLPDFTAEQVGAVLASDGWKVRWDWSDYSTVRELVREMPEGAAKTKIESLCGKGLESPGKVAAWVKARAVTSAALAKTAYLGASFDLDLPLIDAGDRPAEVELAEIEDDPANGFSFKIAVAFDGAATPEVVKAAAERVSKYIFATGDLGDGFETTVDASRITIGDDGLVTIRPDPKKTAEFFRVIIPKD